MLWLLLQSEGLMGVKCGPCHRGQPGAYYSGEWGLIEELWQVGGGGAAAADAAVSLEVRESVMMDTADRPVRKFRGKGEEAPSSEH